MHALPKIGFRVDLDLAVVLPFPYSLYEFMVMDYARRRDRQTRSVRKRDSRCVVRGSFRSNRSNNAVGKICSGIESRDRTLQMMRHPEVIVAAVGDILASGLA